MLKVPSKSTSKTSINQTALNFFDNYQPNDPRLNSDQGYEVGIDEAGRGPVLGPMIYGGACWDSGLRPRMAKIGFTDSKKLKTEEIREEYYSAIEKLEKKGFIHTEYRELTAKFISNVALAEPGPHNAVIDNLNSISHKAAISIIRSFIDKGLRVTKAFVDTVGPPEQYKSKLVSAFSDIQPPIIFTVESKADNKYPVASAASNVAKVIRDRKMRDFKFQEKIEQEDRNWGCGYPGDPVTVAWLDRNWTPFFGYPNIVRFNWKTISKRLEQKGLEVLPKLDIESVSGQMKLGRRIGTVEEEKIGGRLRRINLKHSFEL